MYCFNKTKRLLKKKDFNHVFAEAKKIATPELIILYRENDCGFARIGFAISKKKIAKAHDRNHLKRLLRESFRLHDLPAIDIVVLARNDSSKVNNSNITAHVSKAWNRLCALCKK